MRAERHVHVREAGFVVRVQVVRRVEQRHDVREAVHDEPDQLFLAPHLAVIAGEAARALAGAEAILDHPREIARLEALGPPAAESAGAHAAIPSGVARSSASSSCDRARATRRRRARARRAAPCVKHQTVVASVASSRASTGASPSTRPRNDLRDAPTSSGTSDPRRELGQRARATRGCARRSWRSRCPGSARSASASTPAAIARVDPRAQLVADLAHDVVVVRLGAASCAACRACASRRSTRPRRRRRASMSGSAVPPETSLTIDRAGLERGAPRRPPSSCRCSPGRRRRPRAPARPAATGAAPRRRRPARRPGRVDSPPTSSTAAPAAASASPWAIAGVGVEDSGHRRRTSRA